MTVTADLEGLLGGLVADATTPIENSPSDEEILTHMRGQRNGLQVSVRLPLFSLAEASEAEVIGHLTTSVEDIARYLGKAKRLVDTADPEPNYSVDEEAGSWSYSVDVHGKITFAASGGGYASEEEAEAHALAVINALGVEPVKEDTTPPF